MSNVKNPLPEELDYSEFKHISLNDWYFRLAKELRLNESEWEKIKRAVTFFYPDSESQDKIILQPFYDSSFEKEQFSVPISFPSKENIILTHQIYKSPWEKMGPIVQPLVNKGLNRLIIDNQYTEDFSLFSSIADSFFSHSIQSIQNNSENKKSVYLFFTNVNVCFLKESIHSVNSEIVKSAKFDEHKIRFAVDPLQEMALSGKKLHLSGFVSEMSQWMQDNQLLLKISSVELVNSGANIIEELACLLAKTNEYLHVFSEAQALEDCISAMYFEFAISNDFFLEVAKLRAWRYLFPLLIREYLPEKSKSISPLVHATNALWNKSKLDEPTNLNRSGLETMAAILGGADILDARPFDLLTNSWNPFSHRIAWQTMLIAKEEAHLFEVKDPLAGSWLMESLTEQLAKLSWECFQKIEQEGGYFVNLTDGKIQSRIQQSRITKQNQFEAKQIKIIGSNIYPLSKIEKKDEFLLKDNNQSPIVDVTPNKIDFPALPVWRITQSIEIGH